MASRIVKAAFGALALGLAATPAAQAEEGVFFKDLLGNMGLIGKDKARIDYHERAPLVVPPKLELREPSNVSAHARNPQWPNDPDVVAKRREQADARIPVTETERRRVEQNPTLSVNELRAGRRASAEASNAPVVRDNSSRADTWVHPDQLRAKPRTAEEATGPEPARRSLTQPPTGFRAPAAGAPVVANSEPEIKEDEANPRLYQRQQAQQR
jgi:hypothetical protein